MDKSRNFSHKRRENAIFISVGDRMPQNSIRISTGAFTGAFLAQRVFGPLMMVFAVVVLSIGFTAVFGANNAQAQTRMTAFKQAVAEAAARDKDIAAFYKANGYKPIWTGISGKDRSRRSALLKVLAQASVHGLPVKRYDPVALKAAIKGTKSPRARGQLEVQLSKTFLQYARDVQTGALVPSRIDSGIVRAIPYRNRVSYLTKFAKSSPLGFLKALPPKTPEYARLMKEKLKLERLVGKNGWGQKVPGKSLKPGNSGNSVVILRNRLTAMGFLKRTSTQSYDANIQKAVQQFQLAHGLSPDGVVGPGTMTQINVGVAERLQSVIVAMERERWFNQPRGTRHVLVNLTDFTARIVDNGKVTFQTRTVVGANKSDRRSPEFSDVMEHMVINPTWNVPRSIAVKEYLPMLQRNRNAVGHLRMVNASGKTVSRANINFSQYNAKTFPFNIKQPPSRRNALGLVKFIFPNKYNIYLHDTPSKNLFNKEVRAYSHGCIRVHQPFDFAYALLAKQERDPKAFFQARLATGAENVVPLKEQVPVHIMYRTAFTSAKGPTNYRRDIYGRDGKIWNALAKAGVVLRAVGG